METSYVFQRFFHKRWLILVDLVVAIAAAGTLSGFRPECKTAQGQSSSSVRSPTFQATQSIPGGRERVAVACVNVGGQDFIYVMGGQDPSGEVTGTMFYTNVLAYGPIEAWKTKSEFFRSIVLCDSAFVSTQGRLYVLGGDNGLRSTGSVYYAQPQPGTGDTEWFTTTSLAVPVWLHASASIGSRIYVIGGYFYDPDHLSTARAIPDVFSAEILGDGKLSSWEPENSLASLAEDGISAHAAISSGDHQCIYVIGGWLGPYDTAGGPHNGVFRACVGTDGRLETWQKEPETLPLIPADAEGIYSHSAAIIDSRVFVVGGAVYRSGSPESTDSVYIGHISSDGHLGSWTACAHCLPGSRERHGAAAASNGLLYVIGGKHRTTGSVYDTVLFTPLLDFEKRAQTRGPVTYGDIISYTLTLTNLGVRNLENLAITDTVQSDPPSVFEFHNLPHGPQADCQVCPDVTNTITCTVLSLGLGMTRELSFGAVLSQPAPGLLSTFSIPRILYSERTVAAEVPTADSLRSAEDVDPSIALRGEQSYASDALVPACSADLRLGKNGDRSLVAAGQMLTYTLVVYNSGPSTAEDVVVTDDLPSDVIFKSAVPPPNDHSPLRWSLDSIEAGRSREIQLAVQVSSDSSDILTNTAVVDSSTSDPNPSNNQGKARTIVVRQADLRIEKIDDPDLVMPGEILSYTLIITNEGPSAAQGVRISDYLPPGLEVIVTRPLAESGSSPLEWRLDLLAGQSQVIQIATMVDPDARGTMRNVAIVASEIDTNRSNDVDEEWTAIGSLADLSIGKIVEPDQVVNAGERLTYTLWVTNHGPSSATNVVLTDTLPAGICDLVSLSPDCGGNPLVCNLGTLAAGNHWSTRILGTICPNSIGSLLNRAEVRSTVPDSTPGNNEVQVCTALNALADLRLEKDRRPDLVVAGDTATYTIKVSNEGPSDASGVIVSDTLPAGASFVTATLPITMHSGIVEWYIPTLLSGQSEELELVVQASSSYTDDLINIAVVTSNTPDNYPANNEARDWAKVYMIADLGLEKESNLEKIVRGKELVYTVQVTNYGPSDASHVHVYDALPVGMSFYSSMPAPTDRSGLLTWHTDTLKAGDVWTIALTVTVNSSAHGLLVNTASVNGAVPDPDLSNYRDEEWVLAPVVVSNTAYICEDRHWCKGSNTVYTYPFNTYLPVVLKASS